MTTEYAVFESLIDELLQPDQPGQKLKPIVLEPEPVESAPLTVPTVAPTQRDRPQKAKPKEPTGEQLKRRRQRRKKTAGEQQEASKPRPAQPKPPTADGEKPKRKRRRRRRGGQRKDNSPKSGGET